MDDIEQAFQSTTAVLFGKVLEGGLSRYAGWLTKHIPGVAEKKSRISNKPVFVFSDPLWKDAMGENVVTYEESFALASRALTDQEVESLGISNASKLLSKISTTTPEGVYKDNTGTKECTLYYSTQHCAKSAMCWLSKYVGCSFIVRNNDHVFGSFNLMDCAFSINIYSSSKLTRCFEVSDSNACTDCYYCHNCENLENCMFCFNAKGLRYAIGNVEVGREQFLRVKKLLQERLLGDLGAKHSVSLDIFSLGSMRKSANNDGGKPSRGAGP